MDYINYMVWYSQVQFTKAETHQLVTHGVYSIVRHPSYVGWFWWSVGTQVIAVYIINK